VEKVADKTTYFLYADEGLIDEYEADGTKIHKTTNLLEDGTSLPMEIWTKIKGLRF
jgi:hypothetical protein